MNENEVMNVKDSFITDWDVKKLLNYGFENKYLTKEEIKNMMALRKTALKYEFADDLVFGNGKVEYLYNIVKMYETIWVTFFIGERGKMCEYFATRDSKSACIDIINKNFFYFKNETIKFFNDTLEKGFTDKEIIEFAIDFHYHIISNEVIMTKKLKRI